MAEDQLVALPDPVDIFPLAPGDEILPQIIQWTFAVCVIDEEFKQQLVRGDVSEETLAHMPLSERRVLLRASLGHYNEPADFAKYARRVESLWRAVKRRRRLYRQERLRRQQDALAPARSRQCAVGEHIA